MDSPPRHDSSERSVPDHFETFELSIQRIGEVYRASVTASPDGERPPVEIDPAGLTMDSPVVREPTSNTRDVHREAVDRDDLRSVGERLFRTAFVGRIAEAYRTSIERVRSQSKGLRICLKLDEVAELAPLPWEALWDPEMKAFLADQADLPIVRTLRVKPGRPIKLMATGPLRMLALLPEPRGERKLGGATEWRQIQDQLAPLHQAGTVEVDRITPATLDELGQRIDAGPCHVLHIVAHGGAGSSGDGGLLHLETATGDLDEISGGDLARALERRTPPRLVVINACHGARTTIDDAFDGLAQRLLSRGVTAVVAMRTAISDSAAVAFAVALYRQLALGKTIEASLVEARRPLALGERRAEWATPAVYLREANVRIFTAPPSIPSALFAAPARSGFRSISKPIAGLALAGLLVTGLLVTSFWNLLPRDPDQQPSHPSTESTDSGDATLDETPSPCPAPMGLEDLEFVAIEPDVVDTGERKIVVEDAFCIATKEVSRRDWQQVMGGGLRRPDWPTDWPMTDVTIDDVSLFLTQLTSRDPDVVYRLPSEDEWEFAARAGSETSYHFGDQPTELHLYGNCSNYLGQDCFDGPAPVGSYKPNAWGLYDVHGNVAEWVDWPEDDGPREDNKALRLGGSFKNAPSGCAFTATRWKVKADDETRKETGFRVVREINNEGNF